MAEVGRAIGLEMGAGLAPLFVGMVFAVPFYFGTVFIWRKVKPGALASKSDRRLLYAALVIVLMIIAYIRISIHGSVL